MITADTAFAMIADLSPAEQARAARWAAEWLHVNSLSNSGAVCNVTKELTREADRLDPPETVESLRAQRDAAVKDAVEWEGTADHHRDKWERADREARSFAEALDAMRAERDEVWRKCLNLQAELDEREDAAAEREPRVWHEDDDEPELGARALDCEGDFWTRWPDGWSCVPGEPAGKSWRVPTQYAPLIEVLP